MGLLHEQRLRSPGALLSAVGGASAENKLLKKRLVAVGLPCDGTPLEMASRLLLMRTASVRAMLWAAASGFPKSIARVVRRLPAGQANVLRLPWCPYDEPEVQVLSSCPYDEHTIDVEDEYGEESWCRFMKNVNENWRDTTQKRKHARAQARYNARARDQKFEAVA